jgi:hypothetical protein
MLNTMVIFIFPLRLGGNPYVWRAKFYSLYRSKNMSCPKYSCTMILCTYKRPILTILGSKESSLVQLIVLKILLENTDILVVKMREIHLK